MTETFDYHGYSIEVRAIKIGKRWNWEYTINGGHYKQNFEEAAPTAAVAISEGHWHARGVIDRMA